MKLGTTCMRGTARLFLVAAITAAASRAQDLVVRCGETKTLGGEYPSPANNLFQFETVLVEAGGVLRFWNELPYIRLAARRGILVEGLIDVSGENARQIRIGNNGDMQSLGGLGGPGGFTGGIGNLRPGQSNLKGGDGLGQNDLSQNGFGGTGGETSYGSFSPLGAAGGGGARLAADQPVAASPTDPLNLGLVATAGRNGFPTANGAISGPGVVPAGGAAGPSAFFDGNPNNDFWGRTLDPLTGAVVIGELFAPLGGRGGGAGGDSVQSTTFPATPWMAFNVKKGVGGGGSGGLLTVVTPVLRIGGSGAIRCDGGDGARGVTGYQHAGGGSGGGSGGMILIQVTTLDLRMADPSSITALGGRGGFNSVGGLPQIGGGGNGGPGILQLHMVHGRPGILLPQGRSLSEMTRPTAHVLLPEPSL